MNAFEQNAAYIQAAGKKIKAAQKDLMASGIRNIEGYQNTALRILTSANNLNLTFSCGNGQYNDPVKAIYRGFSERPGLGNVQNVNAVDVIDINIEATNQSILGYLVAERGLDKPTDTLWMAGLAAIKEQYGYGENGWVNSQFRPMKNLIRDAVKGAVQEVEKADIPAEGLTLPKEALLDTIIVVKKDSEDKDVVFGRVVDGEIYFSDGSTGSLKNRVLKVTSSDNFTVKYSLDRSQERDGAHTLKLKPKTETIQVVAQPRRIHLEQSYEDNAYMNKSAFLLSQSGVVQDYGRLAVNKLLDTYVKFLDFDAAMTTAETVLSFDESKGFDMNDFVMTTSQAETKNNIMNQAIIGLGKDLQVKCGYSYTALLVDSEAAAILGNNGTNFVANASFNTALDSMIGTYNGIPVVRHHALNGALDKNGERYGIVIAVYKSADGNIAPAIYGEYLPPYSAVPALNFDNAAQYSQELLSMSQCKAVADDIEDIQLGTWLKIKLA